MLGTLKMRLKNTVLQKVLSNKMKLNNYSYDEIKVGKIFEFKRVLSDKDVDTFAGLMQDFNPLHCDETYAKTTLFKGRIIHGMLIGSLFSTLLGMICPGKQNLYLAQSLNFIKPVYPGSEVTVRGTIKSKIDGIKLIVINTEVLIEDTVVIRGEAKVKVRGD